MEDSPIIEDTASLIFSLKSEYLDEFNCYLHLDELSKEKIDLELVQRLQNRQNRQKKDLAKLELEALNLKIDYDVLDDKKVIEDEWIKNNQHLKHKSDKEYASHIDNIKCIYFQQKKLEEDFKKADELYQKKKSEISTEIEFEVYSQKKDLIDLIRVSKREKQNNKFLSSLEKKKDILRRKLKWRKALSRRREERHQEIIENNINKIKEIVSRRKIESLIHFTPINSLDSILEMGIIPRSKLGIKNLFVDQHRFDMQLDYVSTSISFPNYKMFYRKRKESGEFSGDNVFLKEVYEWVVVVIDPKVLWELDCKFLFTNAASKNISTYKDHNAYWDLENMFSEDNRSNLIPSSYTTDPQAEVMVKEGIPLKYFKGLAFNFDQSKDNFQGKTELPCFLKKEFFNRRDDYTKWMY